MPVLRLRLQAQIRINSIKMLSGNALNGNRNNDDVNVNQNNANNHNDNRAFRGSLRVLRTLRRLKPAAKHSAGFLDICLGLEDFCIVDKGKFQKKA